MRRRRLRLKEEWAAEYAAWRVRPLTARYRAGYGRITFHVPPVDPATYSVLVDCPSCAALMDGQTMLWVTSK